MRNRLRAARRRILSAAAIGVGAWACGGDGATGPVASVARVQVAPENVSVAVGNTVALSAILYDDANRTLRDRAVSWNTTAASVVRVSETGVATGVGTGTATITATSEGKSGSATVVVMGPPSIAVAPTNVSFSASVDGPNPAQQSLVVSNGGGGVVSGLSAVITYGENQPTAWLAASLSSTTAPATLTLSASTSGLAFGTHLAIVRVASTTQGVLNSPQSISVSFGVGTGTGSLRLEMTGMPAACSVGPVTVVGPQGPVGGGHVVGSAGVNVAGLASATYSVTWPAGVPCEATPPASFATNFSPTEPSMNVAVGGSSTAVARATYVPVTGAVRVTLGGLPAGCAATIQLAGPTQASPAQVSSGAAHYFQQLAPGQYSVFSGEVLCGAAQTRYVPATPIVAFTVTPSTTPVDVGVAYAATSGNALITTQAVPIMTTAVNTPVSFTPVTASGGVQPYTFALSGGTLPAGLTFSSTSGLISGTPTASLPPTTFAVTVTDAAFAVSFKVFVLSVTGAGNIILGVGNAPTASVTAGQDLVVPIVMDLSNRGPDNVAAISIIVRWDPARFTFKSESAGNWPNMFVNPGVGQILIAGFSVNGATSSFTLHNIVLTATSVGATTQSSVTATISTATSEAGMLILVVPRSLVVTITP